VCLRFLYDEEQVWVSFVLLVVKFVMPSFQMLCSTWSNCSVVVLSLSVSFNPLHCNVVVESCDVDVVGRYKIM